MSYNLDVVALETVSTGDFIKRQGLRRELARTLAPLT